MTTGNPIPQKTMYAIAFTWAMLPAEDINFLTNQRNCIEVYAKQNGISVIRYFNGNCGWHNLYIKQAEWRQLLQFIMWDKGNININTLLITSLQRINPNLKVASQVAHDLKERYGVEVIVIGHYKPIQPFFS
jgi:DNA invertase Pin-like site-specific DNA recombinase